MTDERVNGLRTVFLQRQAVHHRLADGLDREVNPGIARRVALSVNGAEGEAELVGIGLGQVELRDVVGRLAVAVFARLGKHAVDLAAEVFEVGNHEVALQRPFDQQDVVADCAVELFLGNTRLRLFLVVGLQASMVGLQGGHAFVQPRVVGGKADLLQNLLQIAAQHLMIVVQVQRAEQHFLAGVDDRMVVDIVAVWLCGAFDLLSGTARPLGIAEETLRPFQTVRHGPVSPSL